MSDATDGVEITDSPDGVSLLNEMFGGAVTETPVDVEEEAEPGVVDNQGEEEVSVDSDSADGEDSEGAEEVKPKKGSAQERIQELVAKNKELEARVTREVDAKAERQFTQLKTDFSAAVAQLQSENQSLVQQMKSFAQVKADAGLTPLDKAFNAEFQKRWAPYETQMQAERQARSDAESQVSHRARAETFKSDSMKAVDLHVLNGLGEAQRKAVQETAAELTLTMAAAYGMSPDEAAKHTRKLLETYHEARGESKKQMVKQKVAASQLAAPVNGQARVPTSGGTLADYKLQELITAGYEGDSIFSILKAAQNDNFRKVKR